MTTMTAPRDQAAAATQPPTRHSAFMRLTPEFASYLKTLPEEAQARWHGLLRWGRYGAVFTLAAPHFGAHPGHPSGPGWARPRHAESALSWPW